MNALLLSLAVFCWHATPSEAEILGQADARIQKYRTGEIILELVDTEGKPLAANTPVSIEQTRHAFLFGCNIFKLGACKTPEDNAAYEKHFAELLNYATLPFYWWGYEKEKGKPNYDKTIAILKWCKSHHVIAKGHPLAWNWVEPNWLPPEPAQAMKAQLARIEQCTRRFKGGILYWDVVNEATHYDRPEPKEKAPKLTQAITDMGVGAYVREAFQAARRGDRDAKLIINDYRTDEAYAEKVISQLVDEAGKPLYDVIGIQSHQHGGAWSAETTWEVCERFARFGKPLHFTETTFLSGQIGWDRKNKSQDPDFKWESTPEGEQRQAAEAVRFYTILFSHPAVEAITWWDLTDQVAWQAAPAGLLRADMTPKPAYEELHKLIKGKWWTRVETRLGDDGRIGFRGFFGDYRVSVGAPDQRKTASFTLTSKTTGPLRVQVK